MRRFLTILYLLFCIAAFGAYAQEGCKVPEPPVLKSVTVQPETGSTLLKWDPSPSADIAAYLIYAYHDENGITRGDINDTIWNPSATSYSFTSTVINYFSVSYVVSAFRLPNCSSAFSNVLSSIHMKAETDTCNRKINISWNSYDTIPVKVSDYSVLVSLNGGIYTEAGKVSVLEKEFTINNFIVNSDYCIVVRANLAGGTFSSSNRVCVNTDMRKPPQWINADYATLTPPAGITLSFSIDPDSELHYFSLERRSEPSTAFSEIAMITTNTGVYSVTFTDETADENKINYYRLSAMNCNKPVVTSNIASNMVLSARALGNDIVLKWNHYRKWRGEISSYRLFMDTGNGFSEQAVIEPADTIYSIPLSNIMYDIKTGKVCFYISASEYINPYVAEGNSRSNEVCITSEETLTVPNLFTPDNDGLNDLFKPVITFTPTDYQLIISNRQGRILFETRDFQNSWNGSDNGKPLSEGVYLWFIKAGTPSGVNISRSGTVTIIKNR